MADIKKVLTEKIKSIMSTWNEDGIYAISFFVESNEVHEYRGFKNVSNFAISYNTEADCESADMYDEERWNYAYWRQDENYIIFTDKDNETANMLYDWYKENGISEIGEEPEDEYDEDFNYIGKGPNGHYELLTLISDVARDLQLEGFISKCIGKNVPVIVHGLEYAWYDFEATKNANPNGEADTFLKAMEELGFC